MPVRYGFTNRVTLCQTVCIIVLAVKTRGNAIVVTPYYGTHSIHGSLVNQTTFTGQPRQTTQGNASAHLLQPHPPVPSALAGTHSTPQSDHPSVVPTTCSSLSEHLRSHSRTQSTTGSTASDSSLLPDKKKNWRTLVQIANSVVSETKPAQFANLVDYVKPDAIIVTETKLSPDICSSEFMPSGYGRTIRKDKKKSECTDSSQGVLHSNWGGPTEQQCGYSMGRGLS